MYNTRSGLTYGKWYELSVIIARAHGKGITGSGRWLMGCVTRRIDGGFGIDLTSGQSRNRFEIG